MCRIAAVCLLAAMMLSAGCASQQPKVSIDHNSPKLLAVSVHEAVAARDYTAMVEAMSPDFRSSFKGMIMSAKDYVASLESLASEVEKRIGTEQASRFRRQAQTVYAGTMPDPLEGAISSGGVDWNRVSIFEEGDVTSVAGVGLKTEFDRQFVLVKEKEQWYIAPRQTTVPKEQRKSSYSKEAKLVESTLDKYAKITNDLKGKVRKGEINSGNYAEKMARPSAATGAPEPLQR